MSSEADLRMELLEAMAKLDPEYTQLSQDSLEMERRYEEALMDLDDEKQDAVWQFVFQCEAMSKRMLQLACQHMRFPTEES